MVERIVSRSADDVPTTCRRWVRWRVIPHVPASTALFSALGVLAVSSPRLRRLVVVRALLRNLGAHPRHGPHGPCMLPPS